MEPTQLNREDVSVEIGHLLLLLWEREKRIVELEEEIKRLCVDKPATGVGDGI